MQGPRCTGPFLTGANSPAAKGAVLVDVQRQGGRAPSQSSLGLGWRCPGPDGGGGAWEGCKLVWSGRAFLSLPVAPAFVLMCH